MSRLKAAGLFFFVFLLDNLLMAIYLMRNIDSELDLPEKAAGLLGKWQGIWWGRKDLVCWPAILIVEEIKGDKAKVFYSWGGNKQLGLEAGELTRQVDFDVTKLVIYWINKKGGLNFSFMLKDKILWGWLRGRQLFEIKMEKAIND